MLDVRLDVNSADMAKVESLLAGIPDAAATAMARAMNHTMDRLKTDVVRSVTSIYFINAAEARATLTIRRARPNDLLARLASLGGAIPLADFKVTPSTVQLTTRKKKVRVKVRRDGSGKPWDHAFVAEMESGHQGVFERKADATRRAAGNSWGITTLKIREVMGPAIPSMIGHAVDEQQIQQKATEQFVIELDRQVDYFLGGGQ